MAVFLGIHKKNRERDGKSHRQRVVLGHDCVDALIGDSFAVAVAVDNGDELVLQ